MKQELMGLNRNKETENWNGHTYYTVLIKSEKHGDWRWSRIPDFWELPGTFFQNHTLDKN